MTAIGRLVAIAVVTIAAAAPVVAARAADLPLPPTVSHRTRQYVDDKYRFSVWYPAALPITAAAANDDKSFPGGVVVEALQVATDGISLYVVNSPQSTITDEPNGHAAPIAQTKYFYDAASQRWMVAYPEGTDGSAAPAPADVSQTTVGGQPMLPSSARFDTTIIPLSTTQFVVVQDGGAAPSPPSWRAPLRRRAPMSTPRCWRRRCTPSPWPTRSNCNRRSARRRCARFGRRSAKNSPARHRP
jgi:hypothetical protein